jgi:hypothetical protein
MSEICSIKVYDFDKTIYDGDCTLDFYFYCLIKHPIISFCLPIQVLATALYFLNIISKTIFKQYFFVFLKFIRTSDSTIFSFWEKNEHKIKDWYLKKDHTTDVIISASPEFLLMPICNKIGVKKLIASRVNKFNGKYDGLNCYGKEKLIRLNLEFDEYVIEEFYSDSSSDKHLADISQKNFKVKKDNISNWSE